MAVLNNTAAPAFDVINHPVKDTLLIVSCLLSKLVHRNDSCYNPLRDPITLFHSRAVPRISIEAYLTRILQYIPFTNEVLLNVLVFLDRIGGLEGVQMNQGGLLTTSTSSTTSTYSSSQSNALSSAPRGVGRGAPASFPTQSSFVPVGANGNDNNSRGVEDPEISCNPASSLSSASSSSASHLSLSNNSTETTCNSTTTMTPGFNSDSSLPMIQKRGREAEAEETSTTEESFNHKKSKYGPSSSMPSPPLAATIAASPIPEPVQQPTTSNGFRINSFNIHRLLITSLMIAAKFTSDLFYSNARYAKVGGLALQELNQLELEFLFTSKFELNVKVDELQKVGNSLLQFRDRHMVPPLPLPQLQQSQTMTMMAMQHQQHQQQLQFQAQLQAQIQATSQIQALALKQQQQAQQAGTLLSPPEEKRPWDEESAAAAAIQNHSYYIHQA
ncbi:hypothetical protein BGZ96_004679 [Linnemannia gamsii]|uniref:Cyclin-domain-containing protein n=1 Tax=Linnemannia gamsii TaxID=64522 RepID=A0ABQ7K7R5_9FUNG|nr:hypothetical protein BGZ96_004679 [Linnemannia gamsii]